MKLENKSFLSILRDYLNLNIRFVFLSKVQSVQSASRRQSSNRHSRGQKQGHGGHRGAQEQCQGACTLHRAQDPSPYGVLNLS